MIGFFIVLVALLLLWTIFIPAIQEIQVKSFASQASLIADVNSDIAGLPNSSVKTAMRNSFNDQMDSTTTNFDILSFFSQFWWVFVVLIVAFGTYIISRSNVQVGGF